MASTNAGPEYGKAQGNYLNAKEVEEKIFWLQEMIKYAPKHKSSEKMVAELKTRLIKLKEKKEKIRSVGKTTQKSIKKEGPQAAILGFTNAGKSSLLNALTNAQSLVASYEYTTGEATVGTMDYLGVKIQLIDLPAVTHENFDKGISNNAELLIIVLRNYEDFNHIQPYIERAIGKKIYVLNKTDLLTTEEIRRLEAKLKTNKINYLLFSTKNNLNLDTLKKTIFEQFNVLRIYTKEPKKEQSKVPIVLKPGSTVEDIAEKIYHGMSGDVKEVRIWGPSSKFGGQKVGMKHELKDLDVVEFKTK